MTRLLRHVKHPAEAQSAMIAQGSAPVRVLEYLSLRGTPFVAMIAGDRRPEVGDALPFNWLDFISPGSRFHMPNKVCPSAPGAVPGAKSMTSDHIPSNGFACLSFMQQHPLSKLSFHQESGWGVGLILILRS